MAVHSPNLPLPHLIQFQLCGGSKLLSKDAGEEAVTCEQLPAASCLTLVNELSQLRNLESPYTQVSTKLINDIISSENMPIMLALCSMIFHTYYAHFNAGHNPRTPIH